MTRYDVVIRVRLARLADIISEVMVFSGWDRLHSEKFIETAESQDGATTVRDFLRGLYPGRDFIISTEMRIVQ